MREDPIVDLRSDTVTRPCEDMRRAMYEAEVGDDVYAEDPTLNRLEELAARMLGTEASIFVPTGTMGNQVAVNLHTTPGTEVLVEEGSHTYNYELAAMSAWSGVMPRVLRGMRGILHPDEVRRAIAPEDVYHLARASLLVLENTHNHGGGTVMDGSRKEELLAVARERGIPVHLDGARIFHAASYLGQDVSEVAAGFDSVMFCLSKGLGAPVGSMLCGGREFIERARVSRKRMGGGMRQAGILAAAGIVALEKNTGRVQEDHDRARRLALALAEHPRFRLDPSTVQTNIVIAEVEPAASDLEVADLLRREGVLAGSMGPGRIRFVTHLDIDDGGLQRALEALGRIR
jgi:threonine aldolase